MTITLIILAVLWVFFLLSIFLSTSLANQEIELIWDWDKLDIQALLDEPFPKDFLWGTATAAHQVEGGNDNNNWYWWESQVDKKGNPRIARNQKSGKACEYWTRYPEDIARMRHELGMNSYRFSIEWSRIVPEKGAWNQKAMDTYSRMVDSMLENNIKPMATLHHFSHPIWFHDIGSFEKEENIAHFVDFSQKVFSQLSDRVPNWCTHNESGPFATMGWGIGAFPPGKQDTNLMFDVLCNLMRSHVQVYHTLKSMENGDRVRIGLVKNIFQFDPYHRWNLAHTMLCRFFDSVYNESVISLLRDGTFKITLDYKNDYIAEIPNAKLAADFVGLNYYSNLLISLSRAFDPHKALTRPGQIVTDFPYATYPEGFYRAIMRMASIGLPIIITENGIPDNKDDRRADWIRRYAYAMKRAMNDGANVEGYHYWTLMDNFEWAEGYDMRFGLYEVDFKTQARTLRPGAQPLLDLVAKHKKDWAGK